MRRLTVASVAVTTLALLAPATPAASAAAARDDGSTAPTGTGRAGADRAAVVERQVPALEVTRAVEGLDLPWDVQPIDGDRLLITERDSARLLVADARGRTSEVRFPSRRVWVSGETGLMSLAVDPAFASNRRFYTCQGGFQRGGGHDVRVVAWTLDAAATRADRVRNLLKGLPTTSGRHGGCRLLITSNGSLLVGTGDAAVGTNPRNLRSLGGKTLRLDRFSGKPWRTNPFRGSRSRTKRYVHTYGHRNVQGLAERRDGTLWSVEHGSFRDDEVNRLINGGDYGWHPVPGYNESVPMTDQSLTGRQRAARWRSGEPTIATSGATFVSGSQWGSLEGTMAVAALAGERVIFLKLDRRGRLKRVRVPDELRQFGRLRSVTQAPDGDLLVTTSNGSGDAVLRVSPR